MGKIFAGLLFVFWDFNVGEINILPDFVGYILISLGMLGMAECKAWLSEKMMLIAALISGLAWFLALVGVTLPGVPGSVMSVVLMALRLAVTYSIVQGVCELEKKTGTDLRADKLRKSWGVVLFCTGLMMAGIVGHVVQFPAFGGGLILAAGIGMILSIIYYLACYHKAWKAYDAWREEQSPAI